MNLEEIIQNLIQKGYEGGYWDFKKKWYDNSAKLLHDILCLANNLNNRDAYIIIGVDDNAEIVGIHDQKNRKNTQNLNDFLRNKKFVGDFRPEVSCATLFLNQKEIDVIIIKNSNKTPFILKEQFCEGDIRVRNGNIYTRLMDTNTPIDSTADNDKMEYLFKKRFHIDETPLNKLSYYLDSPQNWKLANDRDGTYYYDFAPEYSLTMNSEADEGNIDFLSKCFPNKNASWEKAKFKIYNHTIISLYHVGLDEYRFHTAVPDRNYIEVPKERCYIKYLYFIKGSLLYKFYKFIRFYDERNGQKFYYKTLFDHIILFESEEERTLFEQDIKNKIDNIYNSLDSYASHRSIASEWQNLDEKDYRSTKAITTFYYKWKDNADREKQSFDIKSNFKLI